MTQIKCRSVIGSKSMTQAAWKYMLQADNLRANKRIGRERREEAAKKVTLPKLRWMENHD